jgi:hypothetical protein
VPPPFLGAVLPPFGFTEFTDLAAVRTDCSVFGAGALSLVIADVANPRQAAAAKANVSFFIVLSLGHTKPGDPFPVIQDREQGNNSLVAGPIDANHEKRRPVLPPSPGRARARARPDSCRPPRAAAPQK